MSDRMRPRIKRSHEVTVVTVGDSGVGKSSLITRFCKGVFDQNYLPTTFSHHLLDSHVAGQRVKFSFLDTSGKKGGTDSSSESLFTLALREAHVILLCYDISDSSTLFSAVNNWVPEIKYHASTTPIILVGCQADVISDPYVDKAIPRVNETLVSNEDALLLSQQIGAVMVMETSAKESAKTVISLMEMAVMTAKRSSPLFSTPTNVKSQTKRSKSLSNQRKNCLNPSSNLLCNSLNMSQESLNSLHLETDNRIGIVIDENMPLDNLRRIQMLKVSPKRSNGESESLSSGSLRSKSSTLSSTGSSGSQGSSSSRNMNWLNFKQEKSAQPIAQRKTSKVKDDKSNNGDEKLVTIKCQTLTANKTYEEVEIEVPASVYETMKNGEKTEEEPNNSVRERWSGIGTKIKCLFSKTE